MNKVIKPWVIIAVICAIILAWFFTISPFARQSRLENKLQKEMNSIQLPAGMQFQRREDTGDVILGSDSDWGIYFVYSCTGNAADDKTSINQALSGAGYTTTIKDNSIVAINKAKGISINASICDESSFGSTRILMKEQ